VEAMVGALQRGQAIIVFNQLVIAAYIRLRHTFHAVLSELSTQKRIRFH